MSGDQRNFDPLVIQQLIALVKEQCEREHDDIDKKIGERIGELKGSIDANHKSVQNQIATVEGKINSKLDGVDEALRGNGRIGVFEQVRGLEKKCRILFLCVIVLFGFKIWGLSIEDWAASFFKKDSKHTPPAIQDNPTTMPNSNKMSVAPFPVVRPSTDR